MVTAILVRAPSVKKRSELLSEGMFEEGGKKEMEETPRSEDLTKVHRR